MMYLQILSPEKLLFAADIEIVKLPGALGYFEIMLNHEPIISTLSKGKIMVKDTNGAIRYFDINGGVVEVSNKEIRVLIE
jgi:F-type H+-transporting ATPase subunit epsilon